MIRIVFDNGAIEDCKHINKIYVEEIEMDKLTIVGNLGQFFRENIKELEGDDSNELEHVG